MRRSRPLAWIEEAEARRMLATAQSDAPPRPVAAGAVRRPFGWLRYFRPRLFPPLPIPPPEPARADGRPRRDRHGKDWRCECC